MNIFSNFFTHPLPPSTQVLSSIPTSREVPQPPKKYIIENGVKKINPAYTQSQTGRILSQPLSSSAPLSPPPLMTFYTESEANICAEETESPIMFTPSYQETMKIIEEDPELSARIGLNPHEMKLEQEKVRNKYQIPMGLANKLSILSEYQLQFIVDDSSSMSNRSSGSESRWEEAKRNIREMLEICSCIPTGPIEIRFLNQQENVIRIERQGKHPEIFLREAYDQIDRAFARGPRGSTPIHACFQQAFQRLNPANQPTSFYFFGDGVPDGGKSEEQQVFELLRKRPGAERSPFTLIACSNKEQDVKWMNEAEEIAPYCSAIDDFQAERNEVMGDQGSVFPYTQGVFHVCRLVGPLCPDDLDAIDEGIPFTKWTLDNLLGVQGSDEEYFLYFDNFCRAQATQSGASAIDRVKKEFPWQREYQAFRTSMNRHEIRAVEEYKHRLRDATGDSLPAYLDSTKHHRIKG
ncbi:MAG: hypothetical protein ACH350_00185 [Parachlamydiaceae bacterium]